MAVHGGGSALMAWRVLHQTNELGSMFSGGRKSCGCRALRLSA